ncbi:MAG: glycoside hydrolase family 2 TIM barrel-domain containing protein [Bacteroidota bacterium]|nr:glycoside hydrolase family 2 TIM barrel-domain containing protein [Bacteroidota bacterium]
MLLIFFFAKITAQQQYELNNGWLCRNIVQVKESGTKISTTSFPVKGWLPATIPGTVLTTLLNNKLVPDPFYGMNNKKIPDIFFTGKECYTYWFVKDFKEKTTSDEELVWLHLRGINYSCEVYLNGHKLNQITHYGMYLRQTYNITPFLSKDGNNRLAVIVYPPDVVGNPNGGQGGDGEIARNVSHQYVAGWDWIQPIADRNTGIWDKVTIEKTSLVNLKNPHIVTLVPGVRLPGKPQAPAMIKTSAEMENPSNDPVLGTLQYILNGDTVKKEVVLQPKSMVEVELPEYSLKSPKLWWPSGYGDQALYDIQLQFISRDKKILDKEDVRFGVREIQTSWNDRTQSLQVAVNGQKIFIKGGNWIISDAMLRFSQERYDTEIRYHRDMNLNLIRIWGGALTERPEFYQACDKYGMLVFQDFWISGDCNGKWIDPMKKEDQWTRRKYPDDHRLFLNSVTDQVKMIRNHPSLAFWCGGNELSPPEDILTVMQDSILPALDGTRFFFPYSNTNLMSYNAIGGNGDGPYTIQPTNSFWETRTYPFNSEVGSVGVGDYESLERFIPKQNMVVPQYPSNKIDSVWDYHKYIGYDQYIDPYGKAKDIKDFANKAQLVNYDQYRALMEGFSAHMWDWYTGSIIWKTQNPWTALRGQMYDYYLDPNACLYGLRNGSEPLHVMYNPVDGMMMTVNNTFSFHHDLAMEIKAFDVNGKVTTLGRLMIEVNPSSVQHFFPIKENVDKLRKKQGIFLSARLINQNRQVVSDNFYWFPDSAGNYSGLQQMPQSAIKTSARKVEKNKIEVTLTNPANSSVAFFNRLALVNGETGKRLLPVFYSDNYVSVLPGEQKTIIMDYAKVETIEKAQVSLSGWNTPLQLIKIQ